MNTAQSQARTSTNNSLSAWWQQLTVRISSVISAMRSNASRVFGRSADRFDPNFSASLNIDKIAAGLDIENRARADGRNDQPPPTQEAVAGTQKEIIVYFKQLQQQARNQVAELGDQLRDLREVIDLPEAGNRLRDIPSRCENEIRRRIADFQSQLKVLDERERRYDSLQPDAAVARAGGRERSLRVYYVLLAILIGAGAVVAVDQLAPGTVGPALNSASWAVAISLLYVIVPLLLGALVSRSAARNRSVGRLARWLAIGVAVAFVAVLAISTAHVIGALSAGPIVTLDSVKNMLVEAPFAVGNNIFAWTGFGVVALAGLLAFLFGYQSGDRRLSRLHMNFFQIRDEREYRTRQMRKRINAVVDKAETDVSKLLQSLKSQIRRYSQLVETAKRVPESLNAYDIALEDACNILLDRYRTTNGRARRTDWPVSFSEHVCFRLEKAPAPAISDDEERRLERMHRRVTKLEVESSKVRQQLRDLNWRAISEITEPSARHLPAGSREVDGDSVLPLSEPVVAVSSVEPIADHASRKQRSSLYAQR